jgi:hypothetical protein
MKTKLVCGLFTALAAVLLPSVAFAEGVVKVECWGRCDLVNLGQICDAYAANSQPVAVACDDTGFGSGTSQDCGSATCRSYGTLYRSDLLSAYCDDGGGYDATVSCELPAALSARESTLPKVDDGARQQESEQDPEAEPDQR